MATFVAKREQESPAGLESDLGQSAAVVGHRCRGARGVVVGMTVAEELGAFFAGIPPQRLPSASRTKAAMCISSTLASAACGIDIDSARILRELAVERGGTAEATLWFVGGPKLPAAATAQVNAVASDAAASDDSDLRNIVHSGTPASTVSLGFGEARHATGADVVAAVVLGCEAAGRLAGAITPGFRQRGFHGSIGAVFAATVAAGRLLKLGAGPMAHALALAATSIGGLTMAADTSTAREYHAGVAVWQGTQAALAAAKGFRSELAVFEGRSGFFTAVGDTDPQEAAALALADLGVDYDIETDVAIKLAPGSHHFHAIAEAAALAATAGDVTPRDVATITISRPDLDALKGPRHPDDLVSMAHSPAYFAAAAVADRSFGWRHASTERIGDSAIQALCDRVVFGPDPMVDAEADRYHQGATVTIATIDGREIRRTVYSPRGVAARQLGWDDVDAKYRALMPESGLDSDAIEASLPLLHELSELPDVGGLTTVLAGDNLSGTHG
jgi:2-methylcitrate dehydratase PrpD